MSDEYVVVFFDSSPQTLDVIDLELDIGGDPKCISLSSELILVSSRNALPSGLNSTQVVADNLILLAIMP